MGPMIRSWFKYVRWGVANCFSFQKVYVSGLPARQCLCWAVMKPDGPGPESAVTWAMTNASVSKTSGKFWWKPVKSVRHAHFMRSRRGGYGRRERAFKRALLVYLRLTIISHIRSAMYVINCVRCIVVQKSRNPEAISTFSKDVNTLFCPQTVWRQLEDFRNTCTDGPECLSTSTERVAMASTGHCGSGPAEYLSLRKHLSWKLTRLDWVCFLSMYEQQLLNPSSLRVDRSVCLRKTVSYKLDCQND